MSRYRLEEKIAAQHVEIERLQALIPIVKEAREALAAACRVICRPDLIDVFLARCAEAGVKDGVGVRLQDAIKAVEEGGNDGN